jgi:hypothetical protein
MTESAAVPPAEHDRDVQDGPPSAAETPATAPTTALDVRRPCVVHRWDLSRRTCIRCGTRIYVEVLIR